MSPIPREGFKFASLDRLSAAPDHRVLLHDDVVSSRMDSVRVRYAESADIGAVSQLNQHVQKIHVAAEPGDFRSIAPKQAEPFFRDLLSSPANIILIAEDSDGALGYVWAQDLQRASLPLTEPVRSLYIHHIGSVLIGAIWSGSSIDACRRAGSNQAPYPTSRTRSLDLQPGCACIL